MNQYHSYSVGIAVELGIKHAIFLKNIECRINNTIINGSNFRNGRYWLCSSVSALLDNLPELGSERTLCRIIKELKEAEYILVDNYNLDPRDRRAWYSLGDKYFDLLQACTTEDVQTARNRIKEPLHSIYGNQSRITSIRNGFSS